jgi:hypothetical protein
VEKLRVLTGFGTGVETGSALVGRRVTKLLVGRVDVTVDGWEVRSRAVGLAKLLTKLL